MELKPLAIAEAYRGQRGFWNRIYYNHRHELFRRLDAGELKAALELEYCLMAELGKRVLRAITSSKNKLDKELLIDILEQLEG